ncbi:GIN domain-containing protein [Hyphococcus sp.]|uniref:GIN domain-containing protein n=1 Tax=Hyphococcus sp. TaxID=2038636 RepID=UPI003CCC3CCE
MKRSAFFVSLSALAAMSLPANAETRDYDLPEFNSIDISAGLMLVAKAGGAQSVSVETSDGDFTDLKIKVEDGVLVASREWNRLRWHQKKAGYKVIVTARELTGIDASSGSNSTLTEITAKRFNVDISSGSFVTMNGKSDACTVDLSSGANLNAKEFVCDSANIDVSSGGHGEITVLVSVVGDASSGGHVSVYGNPDNVNIDRSSGGRIKLKNVSYQATRD